MAQNVGQARMYMQEPGCTAIHYKKGITLRGSYFRLRAGGFNIDFSKGPILGIINRSPGVILVTRKESRYIPKIDVLRSSSCSRTIGFGLTIDREVPSNITNNQRRDRAGKMPKS